jgi:cobalt-precorrin-5B (C1)-methyltransferase
MMGDHVGYALEACHRKGVPRVLLAAQFAKLVKIACGHPQTHVGSSRLDLDRLADWARVDGLDGGLTEEIECANTARQVYESLGGGHPLIGVVAGRALARLRQWAPGAAVIVLLIGYDGSVQRFG